MVQTMLDCRSLFSRALSAHGAALHFAAHSHHLWPDCTREAQLACWDLAATQSDHKWEVIFEKIIPTAQNHIARILNLPDTRTVAFAPNTHEFINRLLSSLPQKPRIITTDAEFHSMNRQFKRLEEDGLITVIRVSTAPFETFTQRMAETVRTTAAHMVFFSHVFFNSGFAVSDLSAIINAIPKDDTLVVVDGYHGFMALPTDLSKLADRIFYMAGGYKYAMAGEGCCFMHCPPGYAARPRNTGWFADMGALESHQDGCVNYATDGFRFFGATFDPSGLYRFNAAMDMVLQNNLSVAHIHDHIIALQDHFLKNIPAGIGTLITQTHTKTRGHFLTFETENAGDIALKLRDMGVIVDHRDNRLRFGFGLYHRMDDVDRLLEILPTL